MSNFLQFPRVTGSSTDNDHKGFVPILEVRWGVTRRIATSPSTKRDRESSNAEMEDLLFLKYMDSSSPWFFLESCNGRGHTLQLCLSKTGKGNGEEDYMSYTLHNAVVSSYFVKAISQDMVRPVEAITISFPKMEIRYQPYDDDGVAIAPISVGFDATSNTRI